MTPSMDQSIVQRGANARALGVSRFDNPYFKRERMPISTGEDIEIWNAKAEAWSFGWNAEDMMHN